MRFRFLLVSRGRDIQESKKFSGAGLDSELSLTSKLEQELEPESSSSSPSFGGASLPRQMEGPRPRVYPFTTLATKLLGSDADCKGLQPASCFVIQNH